MTSIDASAARPVGPLELWAGAECTVNRVGDRWFDQLHRTGHHARLSDLELVASLGVRRMRFPVLWERVAPHGLASADWRWCDERLERLAALGIAPILGLVHHGSGPSGTHLCDPGFVDGLAAFAAAAAQRYPWVRHWTPINEPLTTARFAALYGHWYPHARDIRSCLRALLNEVRATAAAMRAVRSIIPGAELVQTEDLGCVRGPEELAYQLDYEEHRRWLSLDLLAGRVDAGHPLRRHCERSGLDSTELDELVDAPCPADLVGINYYLTSDRYLDHKVEGYPPHLAGGNGRHRYVDVEAVRVAGHGVLGHRALIEQTWARYHTPVALTEVHLGCTREEQLRWLGEAWHAAEAARDTGVDVRGVTLWSAFGSVDWHCLVTRDEGRYEPGAFDVRAPTPRPTAIAVLARGLAGGCAHRHPSMEGPGWWSRAASRTYGRSERELPSGGSRQPPVVVTGSGRLASVLAERCEARGLVVVRTALGELPRAASVQPWAVLATSDLVVRGTRPLEGARLLALAHRCADGGITLVTFSTDEVFGGDAEAPHCESETPTPDLPHGRERHDVEQALLAATCDLLLVRTGVLLEPGVVDDGFMRMLSALRSGARLRLPDDEIVSLSSVPHLLDATLDLLIDGERGIWHGTHPGAASLFELSRRVAELAGAEPGSISAGRALHPWGLESRPGMRALASDRAWPMPPMAVALAEHVAAAALARRDPSAA